jgi:hypothetical protein
MMISDEQGGAILQWQDSRIPGFYEVLYASRMGPNGTRPPGWPADGLRVTTEDSFQSVSSMVADGAGGAYFGYENRGASTGYVQHLGASGTPAPGWPGNGFEVGPMMSGDGSGGVIAAWFSPPSYHVFAQRYVFDGIVATQLSLASSDARPNRATLVWQGVNAGDLSAAVSRREVSGAWQRIGTASREAADRLRYEDDTVAPGTRYAYRLSWFEGGAQQSSAEAWIDVPSLATLTLEGLRPNPAVDAINVSFSLPNSSPATLELLDLAGRRVADREVGSLGAGRHLVRLDEGGRLTPGVYWVRLRQGGQQSMARAAVMR